MRLDGSYSPILLKQLISRCRKKVAQSSMNSREQPCNWDYAAEMDVAERELSAFIGSVSRRFGPGEAKLAARDWLQEAELMDSPPRSTSRNWRSVTTAASARLASRLGVAQHRRSDGRLGTKLRGLFTRGIHEATGGLKPI